MAKRKTRLRFTGEVAEDGQLSLDGNMRAGMIEHFSGRQIEIIVKVKTTPRRPWTINYWWGVMVREVMDAVNDQCGEAFSFKRKEDKELIHRMILRNCWADPEVITDPTSGEILLTIEPGISDMDHPMMMEMIEAARKWAFNTFGITILLPGEQADDFTQKDLQLKWLGDVEKNP